ncbi:hypothetical protein GX50_08281 [[Emmonsia] crescens]|uniref:Uncharacterized protein n=1 Tax=[Emmonsia] crescens TaxID=73230 RepID=A0A2B7Z6W7_9EURO|nr:hypothetical protein GX50_08281 [Emmonsia crescens]
MQSQPYLARSARSRTEDEQAQLRKYLRSIKDFGELSSLIDDATAAMGLNGHKSILQRCSEH